MLNKDGEKRLKEQIKLMSNNIEAMNVPANYLKSMSDGFKALRDLVLMLEERTEHAIRGISLVTEGFVAISDGLEEISKSEK